MWTKFTNEEDPNITAGRAQPLLVKPPKSHNDFKIEGQELRLLGYELQKAAEKAHLGALHDVTHSSLSPRFIGQNGRKFHRRALQYEARVVAEAGSTCIHSADEGKVLNVSREGKVTWTLTDGKRVVETRPTSMHQRAAVVLSKRPLLLFTADTTLRLQLDGLAQPATGDSKTVERY